MRIPDLRLGWMRRYDFSWFELIFCVAVLDGFASWLLTPARVSHVATLTGVAATHPTIIGCVIVAAIAVGAYRWTVVWGPVRVEGAMMRWQLSGPGPRGPELAGRLGGIVITVVAGCTAAGALLGLLAPDSLVTVVGVAAGLGLVAAICAYGTQVVADRRHGCAPPPTWQWSPNRLHRSTIAPADGYAGALGLAASLMDFSWITDARIVRWKRGATSAPTRRLHRNPYVALAQIDFRRLRRHLDGVLRALICIAVLLVAPQVVSIAHAATAVITVLISCAGNAVATGLRNASESVAIRRALGLDDRRITRAHMAVPGSVILIAAAAAAVAWSLTPASAVICFVGCAVAVLRRGTRPPLPYDAPVVTESVVTGAATQPLMIAAQARGMVALIITAVAASVV
ncbi:DUF6297 family protein [Gordonia sp. NPDC003504]